MLDDALRTDDVPLTAGDAGQLRDEGAIDLRNKAAHDEVLTPEEALAARGWAVGVLGNL